MYLFAVHIWHAGINIIEVVFRGKSFNFVIRECSLKQMPGVREAAFGLTRSQHWILSPVDKSIVTAFGAEH